MEFSSFLEALAKAVFASTSPEGWATGADDVARYVENRDGERSLAAEVLSTVPRVLLIGMPGAGKTTLLRATASQMARDKLAGRTGARTPFFLPARQLRALSAPGSATEVLATYCQSSYAIEASPELIAQGFEAGDLALIVDGLDEISFDWNRVVADLSDLFRHFPKLRGIISSRPAALTANFANFETYTLSDLDLAQQRPMLLALLRGDPELTRRFIDALERYPQAEALARTPLMLKLMLDLFQEIGNLPTARATLFAQAIELSLRRWDSERVLRRVNFETLHMTFAAVAAHMFFNNSFAISTDELLSVVRETSDPGETNDIVQSIEDKRLFFLEIGPGVWSFAHVVYLEYFTAWFLRDDVARLSNLLSRPDAEPVLEFASAMTANPAPLVEAAVDQGRLILAARMTTLGRTHNPALQDFVARAFRKSIDPDFLTLLSAPPPDATVEPGNPASAETAEARLASPPTTVHETLLGLLDEVRDPDLDSQRRGKRFEVFSRALFDTVFKVVHVNRLTDRGEIDLLLELEPGGAYWSDFGNEALVECKNLGSKTRLSDVTTFITKVAQSRRRLGFMVSHSGFTRDALNSLQAQANNPAAPVVIPITGDSIRCFLQTGEAPADFFKNAYRDATLPRRARSGSSTGDSRH